MEIHFSCGNCGQHIAAEQSGAGQTVQCPNCGEALVVPALGPVPLQKNATAPAAAITTGVKTNLRQGAAIGGWVCFGVAMVFLLLPVPTWFIYGPLLLVSFILSIVAMAQGRVASGLVLLLANIIGVPIVWVIAVAVGLGAWSSALSEAVKPRTRENALSINCEQNLKQIGLAARLYATEHGDQFPQDFLSMSNELASPKILVCRGDASKSLASSWARFSSANVSYEYLIPGAKEADALKKPMFRCPIHNHACYGDGSVIRGTEKSGGTEPRSTQNTARFAALDAKNGFRDLTLGTQFGAFSDLKPTRMFSPEGDEKRFNLERFDAKLGEFEISQIVLVFDTEVLKEIVVYARGKQNIAGLRETLIQAYGQPDKVGFLSDDLVWRGEKVVLRFHTSIDESAWATFESKEVAAKLKAAAEKKAKEGAEEASKKL